MPRGGTASPLVAGVALLERAVGYTLGSLVLVTSADLARRTPCDRWDLHMLLDHMNDSLLALEEATTGHSVCLEPVPAHGREVAAVSTLRDRACRLVGDWSRAEPAADGTGAWVSVGGLAVTSSLVAAAGALEVAVHGWDVARACGRPRRVPASLAAELLDLAPLLVRPADRRDRFGPPVYAGARAPGDRLVAHLGRDPDWAPR